MGCWMDCGAGAGAGARRQGSRSGGTGSGRGRSRRRHPAQHLTVVRNFTCVLQQTTNMRCCIAHLHRLITYVSEDLTCGCLQKVAALHCSPEARAVLLPRNDHTEANMCPNVVPTCDPRTPCDPMACHHAWVPCPSLCSCCYWMLRRKDANG